MISGLDIRSLSFIFHNFAIFGLLVAGIASYFLGTRILIKRYKRRLKPLNKVDLKLCKVIKNLSADAGLKRNPRLFFLNEEEPNCFVFGTSQRNANLVVTKGLIENLHPHEIRAVILHELSHIHHKDMAFMTWGNIFSKVVKIWFILMVVIGFLSIIGEFYISTLRFGESPFVRPEFITNLISFAQNVPIFFIFFILLPYLLFHSVSRMREYLADARASLFLKKETLNSALTSIINAQTELCLRRGIKRTIIPKFLGIASIKETGKKGLFARLFFLRTHPSLDERRQAIIEEKFVADPEKRILPLRTAVFIGIVGFYTGLLVGNLLSLSFEYTGAYLETFDYLSYRALREMSFITFTGPVTIILLNFMSLWHISNETRGIFWLLLQRNLISFVTFILLLNLVLLLPYFLFSLFISLL
jgi:heat shock protein HtpX